MLCKHINVLLVTFKSINSILHKDLYYYTIYLATLV